VSRRLVFRPQASKEVRKAAEWYEKRGPGLSAEFLRAFDVVVGSVHRNPDQYPAVHKQLHRAVFRRFPYSLIYRYNADEVVVVACVHWRQHPQRWTNRR
jgi:plasmid stabilization system protein ParE